MAINLKYLLGLLSLPIPEKGLPCHCFFIRLPMRFAWYNLLKKLLRTNFIKYPFYHSP
jgi:hypothetical protein